MISNVVFYVTAQALFVLLMCILQTFNDKDSYSKAYRWFVLFPWQVFLVICSIEMSIEFFERSINGT